MSDPSANSPCKMTLRFRSSDAPAVRASLDHKSFADSIVDALAPRLEEGLLPILPLDCVDDEVQSAQADVRILEDRLKQFEVQEESILQAITSGNVSDRLLQELDGRFERLREDAAQEHSRLAEARIRLDRARQAYDEMQSRRHVEGILHFVSGLRDPHSSVAQRFFTTCLANLEFRLEVDTDRSRWLHWTGTIIFSADGEAVSIPFSGRQVQRRGAAADTEWVMERLLAGTPLNTDVASRRLLGETAVKVRPNYILPRLSMTARQSWILHVGDSALLKGYLALYARESRIAKWEALEDEMMQVFGDAQGAQQMLARTHDALCALGSAMWSRKRLLTETQSLIRIANGDTVTKEHLPVSTLQDRKGVGEPWKRVNGSLRPDDCHRCGGVARARFMIDEPDGYVCLGCRRSPDGLTWPARFDRFIAYPELWIAAGFSLQLPEGRAVTGPKRPWTNRRGWLESQPSQAIDAVVHDYLQGKRISDIVKDHSLESIHDVYRILDIRGIPRRRTQKSYRRGEETPRAGLA